MKNRPIHENLDTSFVNLSALIKYLRRRQFVGSVKVQLNGYKADIQLQEDNQMNVSEHDQISGRISEGEEALQRLLIRAREPGGTINVFQQIEDFAENKKAAAIQTDGAKTAQSIIEVSNENIIEAEIIEAIPKPDQPPQKTNGNGKIKQVNAETANRKLLPKTKVPKFPTKTSLKTNGKDGDGLRNELNIKSNGNSKKSKPSLPDFPFHLTNKVEDRARKAHDIGNEDWQTLLNLTVELLGIVDKSLAQAKLDFTSAFRKASTEIADDYPFLNPANDIFEYSNGKIKMTEQVNPKIFIASIIECLRRILNKLESNPKFFEVHRTTVQRILALMNKRENLYNKFSIIPQLKKILGA